MLPKIIHLLMHWSFGPPGGGSLAGLLQAAAQSSGVLP